jgi:hypothetical protein
MMKPGKVPASQGALLEHFNTVKINANQQAEINLLLFKAFICCALPFRTLKNKFFKELLNGLVMNYVVPNHSTFFTQHISQESTTFHRKLKDCLKDQKYLTLSFDGWST